ncbi:acyl-CoA dehydrogenase C-terminal domain-containing protein [Rhizobium sp. KVB221]|uniref:3-methylmercaptopropionyl-CoA dehydrogenase n=1 Tax=Rhizobium setariae TaxID=2801340 RepID=A0A936YNB7_9HYPH|nr:acyl-CoA dehydrogenase C-terminal domain-containing protein [Rhizobium setariae]MBL0371867.1 acyl-CoA dehydrogenase C-terminal domain-containing protein [Rhizobium setariae]
MPVYKAPVEDTLFVLNDVLGIEKFNNLPGFAEVMPDLLEAIVGEAAKISEEVFFPLNLSGDQQGCVRRDDGSVDVPNGFKQAYDQYCAGGWSGLSVPEAFGGQGLPYTLHTAVGEYMSAANMALMMYPGLTNGAIAAILVHGSEEQKQTYLPNMVSGLWSGTMNLTEPHCGTDLGMLRTRAVPQSDGSYKITGQKIFISAGEHGMTENIIHLVLARIEGAPEGTKGISLFIVPKFLLNADGTTGKRNGVTCGAIEHKMGIHGNATCVLNHDEAVGYLIGQENKGLAAMFVMMNEARLGVGLQGLAVSEAAYQNAANYARERIQGRSLTGPKQPDKPADPIIVHADVRRTLMQIRSINEAGRAFMLYTALQSDIAHRSPDASERQKAEDILSIMTPILKGVMTDRGFENAVQAQQMFGGHGYIEENGMSQYVRDARIAMLYEGANGVQAMDLVGRKLAANGGRAAMAVFKEIGDFCEENRNNERLAPFTKAIKKGLNDLQAATMWFMSNAMAKPDNAGAGATDYMHLFGLVILGFMWGKTAKAALEKQDAGDARTEFLVNKLLTARFYMERMMPETAFRKARIEAGADSVMALAADAF